MPQLGRLSSQGLAGLVSQVSAAPTRSIAWTRYSLAVPTTGLEISTLPSVSNGTVAFFPVNVSQNSATNRVLKFNGSALVEQVLPSPTVPAVPRFLAYGNGRFVLLGHTHPVATFYDITCAWVSTDGGNTFSVTNLPSGSLGAGGGIDSLSFANNTFYAFSYAGSATPISIYYQSSSNGSTWSSLVSGGTSTSRFPLRVCGSSGTRIFSRGYLTAASNSYQRLISSTLSSVPVSPSIGNDSGDPRIDWVRGFGFVLATDVASGPAYYITEANLDSGASPSVWSTPGSGFSQVAVADNGIDPPVVAFKNFGFGALTGRISFDGGSAFSSFTLPTPPSGSYPSFMRGYNNRIFVTHATSNIQQDITVGVIT